MEDYQLKPIEDCLLSLWCLALGSDSSWKMTCAPLPWHLEGLSDSTQLSYVNALVIALHSEELYSSSILNWFFLDFFALYLTNFLILLFRWLYRLEDFCTFVRYDRLYHFKLPLGYFVSMMLALGSDYLWKMTCAPLSWHAEGLRDSKQCCLM